MEKRKISTSKIVSWIIYLAAIIIVFGEIVPRFISAKNWFLVIIGFTILVAFIAFAIIYIFKHISKISKR